MVSVSAHLQKELPKLSSQKSVGNGVEKSYTPVRNRLAEQNNRPMNQTYTIGTRQLVPPSAKPRERSCSIDSDIAEYSIHGALSGLFPRTYNKSNGSLNSTTPSRNPSVGNCSMVSIVTIEAACDADALNKCFKDYFKAWGFPDDPYPPTEDAFIAQVDTYLNSTLDNIDIACGRYSTFYNCVGNSTDCYNYENFKTALANPDNATTTYYVIAFYEQQYICGDGLNGYKKSWGCNYDHSTCGLYPISDKCEDLTNWGNCINNIINIQCGKDAAIYECKSEEIDFKYGSGCTTFPKCDSFVEADKMSTCFKNYFKAWGFPDSPFPPSPDNFTTVSNNFLLSSLSNIDTACSRYNDFYKCVGSSNNSFSYDYFRNALGVDNNTAAFWVFAFVDQQYTCGDGLTGVRQGIDCKFDLSTCKNDSGCDGQLGYYNCMNNIINTQCGKEAAVYECNAEILDMKYNSQCTNFPDCSNFVQTNLSICFKDYFDIWGFPKNSFPPSADNYTRTLERYLFSDVENINTACNRFNDLFTCAGSTNASFTYDNFRTALGVDNGTAAFWIFALLDMQYTCGDGLQAYKKGATCRFDVSRCRNATDCDGQLSYYNCMNQILNIQCGRDVALYECNAELLDMRYNTNCTKTPECGNFLNVTDMTSCFKTYFKSWGFSDSSFPPSPQDFVDKADKYILGNPGNIDTACGRYNDFFKCVGATNTSFDIDYFRNALGVDSDTANFWTFLFFDQQYSCGDGLPVFKKMAGCNFTTSSCKAPTDCDSQLTYYNCVNDIINSQCGQDVATYECNAEILEIKYTSSCTKVPDCNHFNSSDSDKKAMMLLVFFLFLTSTITVEAACDTDNLNTCFKQYFKAWGFPDNPFPPTTDIYRITIDLYLETALDNINTTCNRYSDFYTCVKASTDCYNYDNFAKALNNADNATAALYVTAFYDQQYLCGDGLNGYKQMWGCNVDYFRCNPLPTNTSSCDTRTNWFNCINKLINTQCGKDAAVFECTSEGIDFKYNSNCSTSPKCDGFVDATKMSTCFKNYFNAWGFPADSYPPSPTDFSKKADDFIFANVSNLGPACDRYNDFYKCIGGTNTSFDVDFFRNALGLDATAAGFWIFAFLDQQYSCADGRSGLEKMIGCKYNTSSCTAPTDCASQLSYFKCVNDQLNTQCGKDVATYECRAEAFEIKYTTPCVDIPDCNHFDSDDSSSSAFGLGMVALILSSALYLLK
ncbi:hypothetical protein FO519_008629 [Halicephalobus sp. NKZ332]|nr:hypothetical protein FO519_008629 [Halicephalobus sp. NKZ332]